MNTRQELLDDEWLIVRNSGEIPEIALHSALHFLTEDNDGPHLQLTPDEIDTLRQAAAERYEEIILRDLRYANHSLSIYRGLQRVIFNWQRFTAFCERQDTRCHSLQKLAAEAFLQLIREVTEHTENIADPELSRIFNCNAEDLVSFSLKIGLTPEQLPTSIFGFCRK